jgi:Glycosyltransferase sugar-binding region containing DXD motif
MLKGQTDPVIFAYWDSRDHTLLGEMIAAWRAHFPEFFVLGDRDILPLVERYFPMYTDLYKKIRLPAAKSDVARLLVLYEFGGVYTDCHMGIRDVDELRRLITCLNNYEAIFLDRIGSFLPRPPGEHFLVNGLIFGQRRSELFMIFARQAFANLAWQQRLEQQYGFVAYTISRLTGPIFTTEMVLQPGSCTRDIRSDFAGRIMIIPEETSPIVRNMYIGYKTSSNHWTVREREEPLFDPVCKPMSISADVHFHNLFQAAARAARGRIRTEIADLRQSSGEQVVADTPVERNR